MTLTRRLGAWSKALRADGFVLNHPRGPRVGAIRVREEVRPLRRLRTIVETARADVRERGGSSTVGPVRRLVTAEGEHAGVVTIATVAADGACGELTLGMIVGDSSYALVEAFAHEATCRAEIHELAATIVVGLGLGLGPVRRRPFLYVPPPRWHGLRRPHCTRWYGERFPREPGAIAVFDARPASLTETEDQYRLLSIEPGLTPDAPVQQRVIATSRGLEACLQELTATSATGAAAFCLATVVDDRFVYSLQLQTTPDRFEVDGATFHAVVDSIEPVPRPALTADPGVRFWID